KTKTFGRICPHCANTFPLEDDHSTHYLLGEKIVCPFPSCGKKVDWWELTKRLIAVRLPFEMFALAGGKVTSFPFSIIRGDGEFVLLTPPDIPADANIVDVSITNEGIGNLPFIIHSQLNNKHDRHVL